MIKFECERCGDCCKGDVWLKNLIRPRDVNSWQKLGRKDILKYICACCYRLVDPDRNNMPWKKDSCPFLEFKDGKAQCRIYEVRPEVCREFPIRSCDNPNCSEKFHFHSWLWQGKCLATKIFREDIIRVVDSQIEL